MCTEHKMPLYISVDVECLGKHPRDYSLASIGACVVGNHSKTFYIELKPDKPTVDLESIRVCGFTLQYLQENGVEPEIAMKRFRTWLDKLGGHPIFVGFPIAFDMMWIYTYFKQYLGYSPFGRTAAGIDIKTYALAKLGLQWNETTKKGLRNILGSWGGQHTHNALDDCISQAFLFERLMDL